MMRVGGKELCENKLQIFLLVIRVMPFLVANYFCAVSKW